MSILVILFFPICDSTPTENFVVVLKYSANNTAIITYACVPGLDYPKEVIDIKSPQAFVSITDYARTVMRSANRSDVFKTHRIDKGQRHMWQTYLDCIANCCPSPIPYEHIYSASQISFAVESHLT